MLSLKSNAAIKRSDEAKNTCPTTWYSRSLPASISFEPTYMMLLTLLAKNSAASSTPTKTPIAKLWVPTVTATVASMTILVLIGCFFRSRMDSQLKVPIETIIITATSAAMGICDTQSDKNTTISSSTTPAISVDKRVRPPDLMLITDWPIIAQPAIPPIKPAPILATPWPLHSRFLSLGVSVRSSTIVAVIIDSSRPTTASITA